MVGRRWSCPEFILDGFISRGELLSFLASVYEARQEESVYDYYLHKVNGKSYKQFRDAIGIEPKHKQSKQMSSEEIADIVLKTGRMLEETRFEKGSL